jgi:hypothetical protein
MLRKVTLPSLVLVLCIMLAAGATTMLFQAVFGGRAGRPTWNITVGESAGRSLKPHREDPNYPLLNQLAAVSPTGQNRYQYPNADWSRAAQGDGSYAYRPTLRASTGGQGHPNPLNQTHGPVQRSWSSIKSMFR